MTSNEYAFENGRPVPIVQPFETADGPLWSAEPTQQIGPSPIPRAALGFVERADPRDRLMNSKELADWLQVRGDFIKDAKLAGAPFSGGKISPARFETWLATAGQFRKKARELRRSRRTPENAGELAETRPA